LISIKKLLSNETSADSALIKVVRILLQGIGQYALKSDVAECIPFHESINSLSDALGGGEKIHPDDLLVRTGTILKGLEDHTRRTAALQDLQTAELKNMVKMLASTVSGIASASEDKVGTLGEIEKQVAEVSELTDIRVMKARLADCLVEIRNEAQRQAGQTREMVERLNNELAQVRQRAASFLEDKDRLTGLPTRTEAEAALTKHAQEGGHFYVALFIFDRIEYLNERFGRDVGDELLVAFSRMIKQRLKPADKLFRWGGPAFLALLPRASTLEQIRTEVGRAMAGSVEHSIQTRGLDVLIPLTTRWTLLPLLSAPRLMVQKIDAFADARVHA
jgi:diguanylate cyclase (GGDEF)-like protein